MLISLSTLLARGGTVGRRALFFVFVISTALIVDIVIDVVAVVVVVIGIYVVDVIF